MVNLLKGAFVASLAVSLWGVVFWWPELPYKAISRIDERNKEAVTSYMQAQFKESGVYMIPDPRDYVTVLDELRRTGSTLAVHVLAHEDILPGWGMFLAGFVRVLISTLVVGWLLRLALPVLSTYPSRVFFVTLIGFALVIYRGLADPIWWYHPWAWSLVRALFDLIAWMIAAVILAAFIRTPR